jgi:hypothetical protein
MSKNMLRRMRIVLVATSLFTLPALAQSSLPYPVAIPTECLAVAQREGVPTILRNDAQTKHARMRLARLNDSDPSVRECRQAVRRAMARYGQ